MATFPAGCAMVWGGSGGLGSAIARSLACAGADIAIACRDPSGRAATVCDEARALDRTASAHAADVTAPDGVAAAIAAAQAHHGRIHTLVWAVGPLVNQRYVSTVPMDEWRRAFDVEVHGFLGVVQAVLPHMRANGGGSFVTLGSAGHELWPRRDGMSVAVKASNEQLVRGIAKEEGRYRIRANSVLVGVIDAGMHHELVAQGQIDDRWMEETYRLLCLKRLGTAEEVGQACVYFASDEAAYVTGQTLSVSGGLGV